MTRPPPARINLLNQLKAADPAIQALLKSTANNTRNILKMEVAAEKTDPIVIKPVPIKNIEPLDKPQELIVKETVPPKENISSIQAFTLSPFAQINAEEMSQEEASKLPESLETFPKAIGQVMTTSEKSEDIPNKII